MTAPPTVFCAGCGDKVEHGDVFKVREAQIVWCLPFKRTLDEKTNSTKTMGTHTDPQEFHRTQVYMCDPCWKRRVGPIRSRSLWPFLDAVNNKLRNLVTDWVGPREGVRHNLFEEITERRAV